MFNIAESKKRIMFVFVVSAALLVAWKNSHQLKVGNPIHFVFSFWWWCVQMMALSHCFYGHFVEPLAPLF